MPRPKGSTNKKPNPDFEINTMLTAEFLPFLTEMRDMNDLKAIARWMENPMTFNRQIREFSRKMYNSNGIYTNTIDYMIAMPTLAHVVYGNSKAELFKSKKQLFIDTLDVIRYKEQTRDFLRNGAIDGVYFGYFESDTKNQYSNNDTFDDVDIDNLYEINSSVKASIMQLPNDYCKIISTNPENNSYVMAFDMSYFDQFVGNGLSLKLKKYPKEIRDKYKKYIKQKSKKWHVLNNENTIVLKFRASRKEPWGRPLGLAGFVDMMYEKYLVDTKRNLLDEVNTTIVYQTFPEGEQKGTCSLTKDQQKSQHDNVRNALFSSKNGKGINFFSLASGTKLDKLKTDTELLKQNLMDELISKISADLGFAASLLTGESKGSLSAQQANLEMVSSELFDWLDQISNELNKVINSNIIKNDSLGLKLYYLPITHVNKQEMITNFQTLYTHGKGSLRAWIASTGVEADAYIAMMDEEISDGFDEKYLPHPTSFTISDSADKPNPNDNVGGRPEKSKNELTDNGQVARDYKGKM